MTDLMTYAERIRVPRGRVIHAARPSIGGGMVTACLASAEHHDATTPVTCRACRTVQGETA